jgi:adenylate cyclase class IV
MDSAWRFAEPEETTVLTLERILRGESALVLVSHDLEDGTWQFLDGEHVFEADGTVAYLGEMVQFDPSLEELADLPRGWFAWRTAPDQPWQRTQGEPDGFPSPLAFDSDDRTSLPATNIEIKVRVSDIDRLLTDVALLSDPEAEVLRQEDTFFAVPSGRLKLRILGNQSGEVIYYHREDIVGPKASHYHVAPTSAPAVLRTILSQVLPVMGIVRKRRLLFWIGQTRVHLDWVDGLGEFLELEVVLREGQSEAEGIAIAQGLMGRLGLADAELELRAYIDLLESQRPA